jgi:hypothetical protein
VLSSPGVVIMRLLGKSILLFTQAMSKRSQTGLASVILAPLLTLVLGCSSQSGLSTAEPNPATSRSIPPAPHKPFFQAGFAYSHVGGSYDTAASSLELQRMRAAGGTIVQLLVFARIYRLDAPEIGIGSGYWDRILRGGITRAKAAGLRTMIKLQMWGPGFNEGKFSADIRMGNDADWRSFMANYRHYVLHYARLAADTGADILCIGTELAQASRAACIAGEWRALAKEVHSIYSGPLTYAAHHTEVEEVTFWDSLDYIGIDGYYPLAELPAALDDLEHLSARCNRPVIFTEAGFASSPYALTEPWRPGPYQAPQDSVRLDLQAKGWETLLTELWRRNFVWGVYVWKWHPNGAWGGPANADHTPQGKPALDVIRRFFTHPPQRNTGVGPSKQVGPI